MLGRELEDIFPVGFLPPEQALFVAIMSYNGGINFGLLADYDAIDDVAEVAAGIEALDRRAARGGGGGGPGDAGCRAGPRLSNVNRRERRMRQGTRVAAVAAVASGLVLAAIGPAVAAPGDTVYTGSTAEGTKVKLTVASAGQATNFKIAKTNVECTRAATLGNDAGSYTGFDTSDPGSFADKRSTASNSGGYHFNEKSTLAGHGPQGRGFLDGKS